jgi:hypothetical protein
MGCGRAADSNIAVPVSSFSFTRLDICDVAAVLVAHAISFADVCSRVERLTGQTEYKQGYQRVLHSLHTVWLHTCTKISSEGQGTPSRGLPLSRALEVRCEHMPAPAGIHYHANLELRIGPGQPTGAT